MGWIMARKNTGVRNKMWFDALRKQCVQREVMDKLAKKVIDLALAGEQWAVQEIACRLDGKPAQSIELTGDPDHPLAFTRIERVIVEGMPQLTKPEPVLELAAAGAVGFEIEVAELVDFEMVEADNVVPIRDANVGW